MIKTTLAALLLSILPKAFAQSSVLLQTLTEELNRNFQILKQKADPTPYFIDYAVTEQEIRALAASGGAITDNSQAHNRFLEVSVRVGTPKLDNYHRVRGERTRFTSRALLPLDDLPGAIKRRLWLETDRVYRTAAERLIQIKTNTQVRVAERDDSDDFSQEDPSSYNEARPPMKFSSEEWAGRLRKLSAEFNQYPGVLASGISIVAENETKYFVNTESTRIQHGRGFARIMLSARSKAEDGMDLASHASFEALDASGLPDDNAILAAIDKVAKDVTNLLKAPVVEPYVGPAILSGRAASVFFHEIFGHRVEGHRQKDEAEGQTFTKSVGSKVLPEFLSVVFDPTLHQVNGTELNGWYKYDDEGVAARKVVAVENGILKTFLLSRSPIKGFDHSNGHGRTQPGFVPVSRQSNLIVESTRKVSAKRLREMLIEEVKRQNKPYGLYFDHVTGGFTNTGRGGLQAFKVIPLVVYRVYADGRHEELVRGADIVGTPLASFAKILATSDHPEVFNGVCGAESGNVPVSAVSPALLVAEIEIEKKEKSQDRPPILPKPPTKGAGE